MDRRYLIEILLRARETVTEAARRAASALDKVTKAQDANSESARRASQNLRQQISELERLVAAHTSEKRALEEASAAGRKEADARKRIAEEARKQLEELQKQARIESALAR